MTRTPASGGVKPPPTKPRQAAAQIREVKAGSSYQSQNDLRAHFGLATASTVDRLKLRWPGGTVDVLENLRADEILTIREGQGIIGHGPSARTSTREKPQSHGDTDKK
ncbi:MAG: hypothetical protein DMG05_20705 [Acidobacteria bacterium]|nr:MAG: hypothetical protein DMG05_20705 [Acidobacteriota bacterium]